ncbi:MAG: hypothetical protein M3O36_21805 [Myxococcota bacterium]|nr:hypothetical protein [Myxococcota bacterium]
MRGQACSNDLRWRRIGMGEVMNMSFSMAPLLIHSEQVPAEARDALRAAYDSPPEQRSASLASAARVLHAATGLECRDVRELIGLPGSGDCTKG